MQLLFCRGYEWTALPIGSVFDEPVPVGILFGSVIPAQRDRVSAR